MKKPQRKILYPEDLRAFCAGSDRSCQRLYKNIHTAYKLAKGVRITVYHLRNYFGISKEDMDDAFK